MLFSEKPKDQDNSSRYKEAFESLKSKINTQHQPKDDKISENAEEMGKNMYSDVKFGKDNIDPAKQSQFEAAKQAQAEHAAKGTEQAKEQTDKAAGAGKAQEAVNNTATGSQTSQESADKAAGNAKGAEAAQASKSIKDMLSEKAPIFGKVADFVVDSWEQTFPSDKYQQKAEMMRKKAKEDAERQREQDAKVYTEEELAAIQDNIQDWKRTSLATLDEQSDEKPSIRDKVSGAVKQKFNQTSFAKSLYQSDQYKEYEDFKKEMGQFKEDLNDHLSQSQNPAVIAGMSIYGKVTSESNTAMAIKEMRKYIKDFDVFDLERDAAGIFTDVYNAYLKNDMTYIEKTCDDAALGFFRVMLKKREVEGVYPKHNQLWTTEPADFVGGRITENNKACFTYSVQIQEIHCNISKKTEKIVDGADDRVLRSRYNFILALHETPDLETVGHPWVIIECIPVEATPMLA